MTIPVPRRAVRPAVSRRRVRAVVVTGLATFVLVAALIIEGRSVLFFHTLAPWSSPPRIHFCGRDYDRGGLVPADGAEVVVGASPFQQVTRGPLWQPLYGHPASPHLRATGAPCAMVLYLRQGDRYRSYALSGGP